MQQHFGRNISEMGPIVAFLDEAARDLPLDPNATFVLHMVVEELYTNMVKYNGEGADDILIGVALEDDSLVIELVDFDSKPFDYSQREEVDVTASLHDRKPGGLGIHLVKRFMDNYV
jgi:anti-sigma regulatory factor (Ser/Thr protein kinase)